MGCRRPDASRVLKADAASPWVGDWGYYEQTSFAPVRLELMADGRFEYGLFPTASSAPNHSTMISGVWKTAGDRLELREWSIAIVYQYYLAGESPPTPRSIDVTIDVVPKNNGRVLVAPFPTNTSVWVSLVRKSTTPKPFDWNRTARE